MTAVHQEQRRNVVAPSLKRCCTCRIWKPLDGFNRMRGAEDGRQLRCRECQSTSGAEERLAHREELNRKAVLYQNANPERRRNNHVKNRYGMTLDAVRKMLEAQGGCAICGSTEPRGRGWNVDHDHACCPGGKTCGQCIRGILCSPCNNMIGLAADDPSILRAGADYVAMHAERTHLVSLIPAGE